MAGDAVLLYSFSPSFAATEAGYPDFVPDACLINRYEPGARLTLHQDKNERDFANPIVSVSPGSAGHLPIRRIFWRKAAIYKYALSHGDVVVWGGAARLRYHGVAELKEGEHATLGRMRINLTFRRALQRRLECSGWCAMPVAQECATHGEIREQEPGVRYPRVALTFIPIDPRRLSMAPETISPFPLLSASWRGQNLAAQSAEQIGLAAAPLMPAALLSARGRRGFCRWR